MSRQGPDCAAHPRARGSACASAHPPESHWDSCKTPQFDPNMIPQNRRIVKWEIRRLPYKGGIGRTILPTALTHPITGCTDSVTGKIAVYLQFVCGMLPIFLQIRAVLFTISRSARRGDFRRADSGVRRGLPAFVNVYKNEALFSTFRQFEQIAPRHPGKAGRGGRQGAGCRMIFHW